VSSSDTAMIPRDIGLSNSVSSHFLITPCLVNWNATEPLVGASVR